MCKHGKRKHEQLTEKQKRLDARGNPVEATNRESDWALSLVSSVSPESSRLLHDHVHGLAERYPDSVDGQTLLGRLDQAPGTQTDLESMSKLLADHSAGFKGLIDDFPRELPREVSRWYDRKCMRPEYAFLDLDRGRQSPKRIRPGMAYSRHGGITTGRGRSEDQRGFFDGDFRHGHAMFRLDPDSQVARSLTAQGAPFIGGSSGTLRAIIMDLEAQQPGEDIDGPERARRERILAMHSALMVVAGHHSVSECLMMAQALGYFTDLPDPLRDYDGAMAAWEQRLGELGLQSGKSLTQEGVDEGKGKEQLAFEAQRHNLMAEYERFADQMPTMARSLFEGRVGRADAAARDERWALALDRLDDARGVLNFDKHLIRSQQRGEPKIFTGAQLVERFGGRKPKKSKKRSVAYKATIAALDDYTAAWQDLAGTPMASEYSFNAFRELSSKLDAAIAGAQAYIDKHDGTGKKDDEVATMRQLIADCQAEKQLLDRTEREPGVVDHEAGLTVEQAIQLVRAGVDVAKHTDPVRLHDGKLRGREHCGTGGINTVETIEWAGDPDPEVRVVKPLHERERVPEGVRIDTGIEPDDARFGQRNIATKALAHELGLDALIPTSTFVQVEGQLGLAMGKAPGTSLRVDEWLPVDEPIPPPPGEDQWPRLGLRRDTDGVVVHKTVRDNPLPLEDDEAVDRALQEQLMGLQWLDALCAQTDRHDQNYLISIDEGEVRVTGIDNDFSFGKHVTGVGSTTRPDDFGVVREQPPPNLGRQFCGLPPLIDRKVLLALRAMRFEDFVQPVFDPPGPPPKDLTRLLSRDELTSLRARFDELNEHADRLEDEGKVVDDWAAFRIGDPAQTAKEFLLSEGGGLSYYKRDILANRERGG
jgi:hypothetical protein